MVSEQLGKDVILQLLVATRLRTPSAWAAPIGFPIPLRFGRIPQYDLKFPAPFDSELTQLIRVTQERHSVAPGDRLSALEIDPFERGILTFFPVLFHPLKLSLNVPQASGDIHRRYDVRSGND